MDRANLESVAHALVQKGKGILAADESSGTIKKRFDSIHLKPTEQNRLFYRRMLFTTPGMEAFISGVILFDETIRQIGPDGILLGEILAGKESFPASRWTRAPRTWPAFPVRRSPRDWMVCASAWPSTATWGRASPSGAR